MNRRTFLRQTALASTAAWMPAFLRASSPLSPSPHEPILVMVQLSGGNDGLNTVIPIRDDRYFKARPGLGLGPQDCLSVAPDLGFHPALTGLHEMVQQGWLTAVHHVGYPHPDRSHFRSMDIWHSASGAHQFWNHGWLGRWLDTQAGKPGPLGLELNESLSMAMKGLQEKGLAFQNPDALAKATQHLLLPETPEPNQGLPELAYLYQTATEVKEQAQLLQQQFHKGKTTRDFPHQAFGQQMKTIAKLILSDAPTRVYYAELGGFDTHVGQKGKHERLLRLYGDTMLAFSEEMKAAGLLEKVVCLTFSEFGRRTEQNAGGGTDHGAASVVFVSGGPERKFNADWATPDLGHQLEGDLAMKVDFRTIYGEILAKWLSANPDTILGQSFPHLGLWS